MTTSTAKQAFNPEPLDDAWSRWFVGEWAGAGTSDAGTGRGTCRVELALGGQFLICRGQAAITAMSKEQEDYLRRNMGATDREIARFKESGYEALEVYTTDPATGEVLGQLFDNLRCIASGRGKREGMRETVDWEWRSGHRSTRVTERIDDEHAALIERTPMPDGSVMEDRSVMTRCGPAARAVELTEAAAQPSAASVELAGTR